MSHDASEQSGSRLPPLLPADLPTTILTVSKAVFRPGFGGRTLNIMMSVQHGNGQGWNIQKKISDFLVFDEKIRKSLMKAGMVGIPGPIFRGSEVWTDRSPRGLDPRKVRNWRYKYFIRVEKGIQVILQRYWEELLSCDLPPDMQNMLISFLTRDVPEDEAPDSPGHKEGYMLKLRRRTLLRVGPTKLRYYVLNGPDLTYFDSVRSVMISLCTPFTTDAAWG